MDKTLLSIGHGYSAQALGKRLLAQGWRVIGTTRSTDRAGELRAQGVEPLIWPGDDLRPALASASHLLSSVAPTAAGDPVLAALAGEISEAASHLDWAGYLSTVGVYGDHAGGWVDERTLLTPATERGRLRVAAEAEWRAMVPASSLALHIFRLAGIYGPGRGPFAKLRAGTARCIVKPGQVFSRIHVDDIARVLLASMARPRAGAVYNVCDNEPAPPQAVIAYAAQILGVPVPQVQDYATSQMTPMARSFYAESKRVCNDRIKDELGVELAFGTYRAGLKALLAMERD